MEISKTYLNNNLNRVMLIKTPWWQLLPLHFLKLYFCIRNFPVSSGLVPTFWIWNFLDFILCYQNFLEENVWIRKFSRPLYFMVVIGYRVLIMAVASHVPSYHHCLSDTNTCYCSCNDAENKNKFVETLIKIYYVLCYCKCPSFANFSSIFINTLVPLVITARAAWSKCKNLNNVNHKYAD